ncbi:LysE family translocator [Nisaea acidiphila]|uniref:LysE family translocator n=1 Tax=Nisaea acidiphila TaxID=1862145 RepID=A0A9J7AS29_9PROT|nr:LysE family translocator [Nisaea acidiphila]UUX50435.1 LysE family translocator [Nisaea acidiphila]
MLDQILVILGITTLIMISPGPDMVIVMRNTIIGGRAAGLKSSLGVLAGNMVHITYCAIGIGILISQSILAFNILKYAGAAYLIYLGVMSFFAGDTKLSAKDLDRSNVSQRWFLQGFLNNILNPKGTLFYLGVFTMVITPETATGTTLLLVAIMMAVSAVFWLFFVYTLDSNHVRRVLERGQKLVNRIFGGLLIFLGIRVAFLER